MIMILALVAGVLAISTVAMGIMGLFGILGLAAASQNQGGGAAIVDTLSDAESGAEDALTEADDALTAVEAAYQEALRAKGQLQEAGQDRYATQKLRVDLEARLADAEGAEAEDLQKELDALRADETKDVRGEDDAVLAYAKALEALDQSLARADGTLSTAADVLDAYEQAAVDAQREAARAGQDDAEGEGEIPVSGDPVDSSLGDRLIDLEGRLAALHTARDSEFPPAEELVPEQLGATAEGEDTLDPTADTTTWVAVVATERATEGEYVRLWVVLEDGAEVLAWDRSEGGAKSAEELARPVVDRLRSEYPEARIQIARIEGADEAPVIEAGKPFELYGETVEASD